jgi:phenylacetate-coenzyme A ligase PaaK-like adenylate-forming protein
MVAMTPIYDPFLLSAVSLDVLTVGRATPAAVQARQRVRLAALLDTVKRGSRFYQQHWRGVDLEQTRTAAQPLLALPVVKRHQLMAHFDDWVTDPRIKLAELQAFMADPTHTAHPYLGRYVVWESSGTSGQPGVFVQDVQAMTVYDALEALRRSTPRSLMRWMDPLCLAERIALVTATSGHFASLVSAQRLRQLNPWVAGSLQVFSIMQPVNALVDALNAWAPTVLATYPTVAALLAQQATRGALRIHPQEVWTGGETLGAAVRQQIAKNLGSTVRNNYGASEFLAIGWECAHGQLHQNADWVMLEPVDEHYRPVPPGQPSYTTLLTHLANTVQPLVRYELGDQIRVHADRCACGSPLPVMEVQGRRDQPLVMAGQHGEAVTLLPMALTTVLEDQAGVYDFQLRQHNDTTLVLRLPQGGEAGHAAMARCRRALGAFAEQQGVAAIQLLEEVGQPLPRGRSGKMCRVIAAAPVPVPVSL